MEQVQPIFLWSNLFGLIPFRNLGNGNLLSTSLNGVLLRAWCWLVFLFQLSEIVIISYVVYLYSNIYFGPVQSTISTTTTTNNITYLIFNLTPRLLCLRSKHLDNTFRHIRDFDKLGNQTKQTGNLRKRLCVGIVIGMVWASTESAFIVRSLNKMAGVVGFTLAYLIGVFRLFGYMHQIFVYVSIYAAVQTFNDRIKIAELFFKKFQNMRTMMILHKRLQEIYTVKEMLTKINWASEEFVTAYAPLILTVIVIKLVTITNAVFRGVSWLLYLVSASAYTGNYSSFAFLVFQLTVDVGLLLIIFHLADVPANQMQILRHTFEDCDTSHMTPDEKTELKFLVLKANCSRIQLTAGGLFGVGKHLIPGLTGTIITYIVILLQTRGTP